MANVGLIKCSMQAAIDARPAPRHVRQYDSTTAKPELRPAAMMFRSISALGKIIVRPGHVG